jgi:hypothetical protein
MIFIIISIYFAITLPHSFVKSDVEIKGINVTYFENTGWNGEASSTCNLNSKEEIDSLVEIFEDCYYRYYLYDPRFIINSGTPELRVSIGYNNNETDVINIFADGSFTINTKIAHIGVMGKTQGEKLYTDLYKRVKYLLK